MITVNIQSGDAADIFVTVTDNNTAPPQVVMNQTRLNYASAVVAIAVQEGGTGKGKVAWTAVRCDDATQSHSDNALPDDGDLVYVNAG